MAKKQQTNYLDYIPVISDKNTWSEENGKVTVTKRDSGDYDIALTPSAAARLLLAGEGHTAQTAIFINGVELKNDAEDFFKAFPRRATRFTEFTPH